jgi:hypothetical protein
MSPRRLLSLPALAMIITLAIAVSAQVPPATTSDSASDPNVLANQCIIEMAAAKLPEEIIITKIQTSKTKFDLPTPALVEPNNSGVSANVVKAMTTPKNAPPRRGSHKSLTKERT